jgi:hypothetical protein
VFGIIRPLSIPAVRDRIVRAALKIVLELVFEADFLPCSFGFRTAVPACVALRSDRCEGWSPQINRRIFRKTSMARKERMTGIEPA